MNSNLIAILGLGICVGVSSSAEPKLLYPPSKIDDIVDTLHDVKIPDPYRWLEKGGDPAVKEWTAKQNAFTREWVDRVPGLDKLRARLDQLLDVGTISVAIPRGEHVFYTKRAGKQNQSVLYVVDQALNKPTTKTLVDPNPLTEDGTVTLDWWFPDKKGERVAYGLSASGSEQSTLHVRDVKTGKDLDDRIERARACSVAWTPDGKGFYYTRYPRRGSVPMGDENYFRHVYFHELGADPAKDVKVFGAGRDAADWPSVSLSPDGRWLVVTVEKGWAKSEVYFKDLLKNEEFVPLVENNAAIFKVVPRDDYFYVLTNEKADRFRLLAVEPAKPERANWKEIIPEGRDILESVTPVGKSLVALYLREAASELRVMSRDGKNVREVKLPAVGSITGLGAEAAGHEIYFGFQSYTVPPSVYRLDLHPDGLETGPQSWNRVETALDLSAYRLERIKCPSKDGTLIPVTLISKKGFAKDGNTPTVLYGYGGFNISLTPTFNPTRFLTICEYGGIMAIANLRGGGEFGEEWHAAGMLANKQHVFDDFIAAAEFLIKEKFTDREHLGIMGRSNGGLLVGAAVTQRPDLFRAAICGVPLLDMLRYHRFLIAKLWIPEFGSADEPDEFRWLHAYSPYHRVKDDTAYPAVLFTTAESDSRVDPLHARKMTARLQAASSSSRPILLRVDEKAGHGQGKPRAKLLDEETDSWGFLLHELGVDLR